MSDAAAVSPYKDIIVAAVNAAGPIPLAEDGKTLDKFKWNQTIAQAAVDIAVLTNSNSPVAKRLAMLNTCKKFVATIQGVRKEASSTRGIVVVKAKPGPRTPDGIETARTERTDSNPETAAFANHLRTLVGEPADNCSPDPPRASADQDRLAADPSHGTSSVPAGGAVHSWSTAVSAHPTTRRSRSHGRSS